jgi:hypothetical protein
MALRGGTDTVMINFSGKGEISWAYILWAVDAGS